MKKFLSIAIAIIMVAGVLFLVGCDKGPEGTDTDAPATLKFGMGVVVSQSAKDATDEANGEGKLTVDIAAVTVDADGKIVKCVLDCAESTSNFTIDGAAVEAGDLRSKYEKGDDYGMSAIGTKEWYVQADSFAKLIEGKTIDEVKALMAEDYKGTADVVNAGCTIYVSGFVKAIEAAVANAADSKATADSTLKLGVVTSQTNSETKIELATTVVATALDEESKVVVASTDAVSASFEFDEKGVCLTDTTAAIATKKALGADYGMASSEYADDLNGDGVVKEWFEQGAAFDAALVGKNATEIGALAVETGYGAADLQTAGCTIHVGDMVKAAVKAATK